jgi:hypothetical protein
MLGFRRRRQAESIAHGCASTLATLHHKAGTAPWTQWSAVWGIKLGTFKSETADGLELRPSRATTDTKAGECWFRRGCPCPFSRPILDGLHFDDSTSHSPGRVNARRQALISEVSSIYEHCGKDKTHQTP